MIDIFLIEILTEELPPYILKQLEESFLRTIFQDLKSLGFLDKDSNGRSYITPRRLAISINKVKATTPEILMRKKMLPVKIALDQQKNPTTLLLKIIKEFNLKYNNNITIADLEQASDASDKCTESLFYKYVIPSRQLKNELQKIIEKAIAELPVPKLMSYQYEENLSSKTVHFIRPARSLITLHGSKILTINILGLTSNRVTQGHRFLSSGNIIIHHAKDYTETLIKNGKVIPNFNERKEKIRHNLIHQAGKNTVLMPEKLLDEVTALVEWPVIYVCHFNKNFLTIPQECLILAMQTHQKYFPLIDQHKKLQSKFLVVSNLYSHNPINIITGNERVIQARLSDAKFFFEQDQKKSLIARVSELNNIIYHHKLGSQLQRTKRIQLLACTFARLLKYDIKTCALIKRSALLAKTDLVTNMVNEFPELQGIIGMHYAKYHKELDVIALAIKEHYQPRFSGDTLPASQIGILVALADKLETLVGMWGIGLQPNGEKDPFGLRRHTLGILRILIEKKIPIPIIVLLKETVILFKNNKYFQDASQDISLFIYNRLYILLYKYGYTKNHIASIVSKKPEMLHDILLRLNAIQTFTNSSTSKIFITTHKRINNILKNAHTKVTHIVQKNLLCENIEIKLYTTLKSLKPKVDLAHTESNFLEIFKILENFILDINLFFKQIVINTTDEKLRCNRHALLDEIRIILNSVTDISKLVN